MGTSDLQVAVQSDPASLRLPTQLTLVNLLQQVDVLLTEGLPAILWLKLPNHARAVSQNRSRVTSSAALDAQD